MRRSLFIALQLAILALLVAWSARAVRQAEAAYALPAPRPEPLAIAPLHDDPAVVSDEELERVLAKTVLPFSGGETRIGHVDHYLRFAGPEAMFEGTRFLGGGRDLLRLVTDHRLFATVYGEAAPPLLIDTGAGVRIRALEGPRSSTHVDHTLATLAEIGMPLDLAIHTAERRASLREVLEQSLLDFSLDQPEYEWSALAYALYLPEPRRWMSREGRELTFDRLAARIRREELPRGVCSAHHRLYTLAVFLRVDDALGAGGEPLLSPAARAEVVEFLRGATGKLVAHQHPGGFWNEDWPRAAPATEEPTERVGDRLSERLLVTGHALEWWAIAPEEVQPPRPVVSAAARWLVTGIDTLEPAETEELITYLTHAARGLALWRGRVR